MILCGECSPRKSVKTGRQRWLVSNPARTKGQLEADRERAGPYRPGPRATTRCTGFTHVRTLLSRRSRLEDLFDFVRGPVGYRFRAGLARGHALVKAAGVTRLGTDPPGIVDATAGLGRDAFLLASLGPRVTLIERSARVHDLLQQGMAAARAAGPEWAAVIDRMTLLFGDAREVLPRLGPDVVIVDPMHPPRGKTALVKKEMQELRKLVGADDDALELMQVALACAAKRVVLKWPLRIDPLPELPKPSYQIAAKTVRYDVFLRLAPM
jgi:16S rRNA (guanine1516-N2)-methyltransferase